MRLWFVLLSALCWAAPVWAQPCSDVAESGFELAVEGLGVAYFSDFGAALQSGEAELSGGVCLVGDGWELRSEVLRIAGISGAPKLSADEVELRLSGWRIEAASLVSQAGVVTLSSVTFDNGELKGQARSGRFDLNDNSLSLATVRAEGEGLRVEGARASLLGTALLFEDALATTCMCSGRSLYVIRAPTASYNTADKLIVLRDGQLELGGIKVRLKDLELTPERFADLSFPITVEYVTGDEARGVQGTGLGIRAPSLRVNDELALELGLVGIDRDYPLSGVLVVHYEDDRVRFDVGRAAEGARADFTLREALLPWLDATFSVRNRDWDGADYLHEGKLGLEARQAWMFERHRLSLSEGLFAAASSQTLGSGPVASSRLGGYAAASYRSPVLTPGRFSVQTRLEATTYPDAQSAQYGLSFNPAWTKSVGPLQLGLEWTLLVSDAGSPFGSSLDKLTPKNELTLRTSLEGDLAPGLSGRFGFRVRYDFLDPGPGTAFREGIDLLGGSAELLWQRPGLGVRSSLSTELAPALNSGLAAQDTFVEFGLDLEGASWQSGFGLRFDPSRHDSLEKVELRGSFPIHVANVTLTPFLAFDVMPTLKDNVFPRVSGQGLELSWRSCCGTLVAAYKQVENTFSTSFSVRFGEN